jgi:hypothetical protein
MAAKPLQIHPAALAELKSAVAWYQKQKQTAALNFVVELDRAIALVIASPGTLAEWRAWYPEVRPATLSIRGHLPRKRNGRPSFGHRSRAQTARILEETALTRRLGFK